MRVACLASRIATPGGYEELVSGHVQLALTSIRLLMEHGHDVELITTRYDTPFSIPHCFPNTLRTHWVDDGRRRGRGHEMEVGHRRGVLPIRLLRQIRQTSNLIARGQFDVIHIFGTPRMLYLAALLRIFGCRRPIVVTLVNGTPGKQRISTPRAVWRCVNEVVVSCPFMKRTCEESGSRATEIRHGILRRDNEHRESLDLTKRRRVLFWRDPSEENGADICVSAFRSLAEAYKGFDFTFAIRPHPSTVVGLQDLSWAPDNVSVFRFPYPKGITLNQLLREAICAVHPFRWLSIQPQFAVLESMYAGVAVVASDIDSNRDIIRSGDTGILVPSGNASRLADGIRKVLDSPSRSAEMGQRAATTVAAEWNWDSYAGRLHDVLQRAVNGRLREVGG